MGSSGTRSRHRRSLALLALLVAPVAVPARAEAGNYAWLNCSSFDRTGAEAGMFFFQDRGFTVDPACEAPGPDWSWRIRNTDQPSGAGKGASVTWNAPPGTLIRSVQMALDARSADGHLATIGVHTPGSPSVTVFQAPNEPGGFKPFSRGALGARAVELRVFCDKAGNCPQSERAHAFAREVVVTLDDLSPPAIDLNPSSLLSDGAWVRGTKDVSATMRDGESGLWEFGLNVNGTHLADGSDLSCAGSLSHPYATVPTPCSTESTVALAVDTTRAPFVDGANLLSFGGRNYPLDPTIVRRTVMVDNAPPELAFANSEDPEDPDRIRASVADRHSGIALYELGLRAVGSDAPYQPLATRRAGSEVSARVNSVAYPPGEYEFRLAARDVAGNEAATNKRANGEPMVLSFPLRAPVTLEANLGAGGGDAQRVHYGKAVKAEGRLLGPGGRPLAGEEIVVVEEMRRGALYPRRDGAARTDADGRWRLTIPAGPSGKLRALYAGSSRYLPARDRAGVLSVRSRAAFAPVRRRVREGEEVRFVGRVRHRDAKIPSRGKQLSVQVKLGNKAKWITVKEDFRSRASGRFAFRYRFSRAYERDVRYKFRLKIHGEADWPYLGTVTRPRQVIVEAR